MWKPAKYLLHILLLAALVLPAAAVEHSDERDRRVGHERGEQWHGDIRHFHEHDLARWHEGHWVHGRHAGRTGWWWIVGATWYWYPTPVYPYPDPYQPPPMAAIAPPPGAAAAPLYWYYCANPPGYFPYVPQCDVNWQRLPATPP